MCIIWNPHGWRLTLQVDMNMAEKHVRNRI
jgi:hypothetical protein